MGVRARMAFFVALIGAILVGGMPAPASAADWDEVDFEGSGWGHGVGMSQHGARAAAEKMGWDYEQILTHYFQGTSISEVNWKTPIWVNLEFDFSSLTLSVLDVGASGTGGPVTISSDSGSANAVPGAMINLNHIGGSACSVEVKNPGTSPQTITDPDNCAFDFSWYAWSKGTSTPKTKIQINDCTLPDWNSSGGTVRRPCQYAHGQLHLRHGAGGLDLSAEMFIDEYISGISEVPFSWPMEALKAQAVAARSYAMGRRAIRPNLANNSCNAWCHVKDTTSDQRYVGWGHSNTTNWVNATNSTAAQVLTHPQASGAITAFYSSSSGGATEYGSEKGYGSGPWLSSVDDSWALDSKNPNSSWTTTVTRETIAGLLGWDLIHSIEVIERRPGSNSVAAIWIEGSVGGEPVAVTKPGSWARSSFGLKSEYFSIDFEVLPGEEMFFYNPNGTFRYEDLNPDGTLGTPILTGNGYTKNWSAITAVDLDRDDQDEMFFYRSDGLFRYYEISPNAVIGSPILAGDGYTEGWDAITAVDLDGDGQDEMFFYRSDGLFRYYNIKPNGEIGSPILAGSGYTSGWDAITAVDLDGDGQDEMFFYREDGLFRYYDIKQNGEVGRPINAGDGYTKDWAAISAVDIQGDGKDEMFFYRSDGLYRYYDVKSDGSIGLPIRAGDSYFTNWSTGISINLDGR